MKVLEYRPSAVTAGGFLIPLLILTLFFVIMTPTAARSGTTALLAFLIFTAVSLAVFAVAFVRWKKARKSVEAFIRDADIGERIHLPSLVLYETGTYRCTGEWRSSGRSRRYYTSHEFIRGEEGRGAEISIPKGPFIITVKRDDSGLIEFPAVRILSEPYKNVLVLFAPSRGSVEGSGTLQASWENDSAQLSFRGEEKSLTGRVYAILSRARKVRVEVFHASWPENRFMVGEGITFDFSTKLLPDEDTLIVAYDGFSPKDLRGLLGGGEYLMGHGSYGIRLVLDVPFHRDVVEEGEFEVTEEKGNEAGEAFR